MRSSFPVEVRASTPDHIQTLADPNATTLPLQSTPLDESSGIRGTLGIQFVSPVFNRPTPAQKALEQFYPEISHPQPPIGLSVFPPHQLNLEQPPIAENPRPQSKPDTLHYTHTHMKSIKSNAKHLNVRSKTDNYKLKG